MSDKLRSVFQALEEKLDGVFHTAQDWSMLGPVWRDVGRILGWKNLIDISPSWIDFLSIPPSTKMKDNQSSAVFNIGGGTNIGGVIIPDDEPQVRELAEIFRKNPAAVRQQKQTIVKLLTRLHGNNHAHHHGDEAEHRAEHEKDRRLLSILTRALTTALPDIKPKSQEITALTLDAGVQRVEKESFLVLQRLSNQYAPESTDRTLLQQVRHTLAQVPLEQAKAAVKPKDSFFNKIPWLLLLSGSMMIKPVVDLGMFAYAKLQPTPPNKDPQEQVNGSKQTLAEKSEKPSLYLGAVSLAIFITLLKRRNELNDTEKKLKIGSGAGHFGTEGSLLLANLVSIAEQYPHFAAMLLQLGDAAKEQIIENGSDFIVVGAATVAANKIVELIPWKNEQDKKNAELVLSVVLSVAATYSIDQALEMLAPGISAGLTAAMAGYATLKTGNAVKKAVTKNKPPPKQTTEYTPSLWVRTKSAVAGTAAKVSRTINPARLLKGVAATGLSAIASFGLAVPPSRTPNVVRQAAPPATETITPLQAKKMLAFYTSADGTKLQELQKRGGSAAAQDSYTPSDPTQYIKDAKTLTGLPASDVKQAKNNISAFTGIVYDRASENTGVSAKSYFNAQYNKSGQSTVGMIQNTIDDLKKKTESQQSKQSAPQDPRVTALLQEIKALNTHRADKNMQMPKMLDAIGRDTINKVFTLLKQNLEIEAAAIKEMQSFLVEEIFERGNTQITENDITNANILFAERLNNIERG
ncbi:MAG: hypothetical protein ACK5XX_02555 [Holosporales bacterium]